MRKPIYKSYHFDSQTKLKIYEIAREYLLAIILINNRKESVVITKSVVPSARLCYCLQYAINDLKLLERSLLNYSDFPYNFRELFDQSKGEYRRDEHSSVYFWSYEDLQIRLNCLDKAIQITKSNI